LLTPIFLISDLHLCAERPHTTQLLLDFLGTTAREACALYVLGDLFEYWAGDDALAEDGHAQSVADAFRHLEQRGVPVNIMHGNRDFLMAHDFAVAAGASLVQDPIDMVVGARRILLTHGDALCTDDVTYQAFRQQVRDVAWQQAFLAQPLTTRKAQIEALRMRSETEKTMKADAIMDVNEQAVRSLLAAHGYPELLIHGHTHRPAMHAINVDGHHCTRWVLGDWHETGDYLRLDEAGCTRHLIS
jgi:UDP-2,3-diacylglucosamine hydrolase